MTFIACLFLSLGMALAQTQVSGTITSSEDGSPVIGASIKVAGTQTGTITDVDGNFSLAAPANAKLEISYIGMISKTVKATKNMKLFLTQTIMHWMKSWLLPSVLLRRVHLPVQQP